MTSRQCRDDFLRLQQRNRRLSRTWPARDEQMSWLRKNIKPLLVKIDLQDRSPNKSLSSLGVGGFIAASMLSNTFLIVAGSWSLDLHCRMNRAVYP